MKKVLKLLAALALALTCLSGCTNKKASIVTTSYPVKYLIQYLAGSRASVDVIGTNEFIQRSSISSYYDNILKSADLFVYIGELEPYMGIYENTILSYDVDIINLASLSAVNDFKRYTTTVTSGVRVVAESPYYNSSLFDLVDTYNKDPFIWLDPIAMASMASTLKDWLEDFYPQDTLTIENNFKTLQAALVRLDAEYQTLRTIPDIKIVTTAATFGNWQKTYGVQVYPLTISKYGVVPNEEQLAFIEQTIRENGVHYIVYDPTLPQDLQDLYQRVKDDLGLESITLSSLSILSADDVDKNKDYMTIMYENLTVLEDTFK
jgi:zinc transport system substrate-binding protein